MRLAPLAAVAGLAACVDSSAISVEEEREMGLAVVEQAAREMPLLQDEPIVRFVRELGTHIVRRADTTGREYEFRVVDSEIANAFAIPGGFIFVNRGILERAETASELAGVLAHEIGHVVERHGLDPRGMPRLFQRLLDEERTAPNELLAWFSTHPLTEDRIAETEGMITQLPSEAVDRASRDVPQFAQMRRRLDRLPPPASDRGAVP